MPTFVSDDYVQQVNDYVAAVDKFKTLVQQRLSDLNKAVQPEVTATSRILQEAMEKLAPPPGDPAIKKDAEPKDVPKAEGYDTEPEPDLTPPSRSGRRR